MVKFLPLILDKLIGLIVTPPLLNGHVLNCANAAFEALAMIVGTLTVRLFLRNPTIRFRKSYYG